MCITSLTFLQLSVTPNLEPVQEQSLLFIEKQAVLQMILQKIAENPDVNIQRVNSCAHLISHELPLLLTEAMLLSVCLQYTQAEMVLRILCTCMFCLCAFQKIITTRVMEKLTELFEEQSMGGAHALVLALHLLRCKQINSYSKLLQLLSNEHSSINREIRCLSHLQSLLPVSSLCVCACNLLRTSAGSSRNVTLFLCAG